MSWLENKPQGCLLVRLRVALDLGDLDHMTSAGRRRGLKILLDAGAEVQKKLLAWQV